jgi:MFS family permease
MPEAIKPALAAFALTFLFTLHATPATYINSNFLAQFFSDQSVGWIYGAGAGLGLVGLWAANRAVRRFGNYRVLRAVLWANLAAIIGLAWAPSAAVSGAAFIVSFTAGIVANFLIDIFVEAASRNADTGKLRGWYLTAMNVAFLGGPLIAWLILSDHQFHRVFLFGAAILLGAIIFLNRRFAKFEDPCYTPGGFRRGIARVWSTPDLRRAFAGFLTLQGFYAWMIIYAPLYLTQTVGFAVHEVAAMITIALVPFLVLQEWLGKLADCCTGEKEFLTAGLSVMGLSTLALAAIDSRSFAVWAAVLFLTRIGAAMVESMCYSYIFRRVGAAESNVMEAFHSVRPVATIVAPLLAAPVFLLGGGIPGLFVVLALACFAAALYMRPLRDSK